MRGERMEPKHIVWNEEKSNRLYDYYATQNPAKETEYFGYQVGKAIVNFSKYFVADIKECKCLDYGCGSGHIIGHFLKEKIHICGIDMSERSVDVVEQKYKGNKFFMGARVYDGKRLPFKDDTFDLIICTEVIEHILPKHMDLFLLELKRVLKQETGRLILTTPNDENFKRNEVYCPECNTIFHKHGHCNKFTGETLSKLMETHGFQTIMCQGTDFWQLVDLSLRKAWRILRKKYKQLCNYKKKGTLRDIFFIENMNLKSRPNLFWVGTK